MPNVTLQTPRSKAPFFTLAGMQDAVRQQVRKDQQERVNMIEFCTMITEFDLQNRLQSMSWEERRTIAAELVACTATDPRKRWVANLWELLKDMTTNENLLAELQKCCSFRDYFNNSYNKFAAMVFRKHLFDLQIVDVGEVVGGGQVVACEYNSKRDIEQLLQTFNESFPPFPASIPALAMDDERWNADAKWFYADFDLDDATGWITEQMWGLVGEDLNAGPRSTSDAESA